MIFKKKGMIDVGELQRQGKITPVNHEVNVQSDKNGFVDMKSANNNTRFYGNTEDKNSEGTYNKREVDEKMQKLDSLIYKLEQRIELLERKVGIDNNPTPSINW